MLMAHQSASSIMGEKEFSTLEWGYSYKGNSAEFGAERSQLLEKINGRFKYYSVEGYVQYSTEIFDGNMAKSYERMSAVLTLSIEAKVSIKIALFFFISFDSRTIGSYIFIEFNEIIH